MDASKIDAQVDDQQESTKDTSQSSCVSVVDSNSSGDRRVRPCNTSENETLSASSGSASASKGRKRKKTVSKKKSLSGMKPQKAPKSSAKAKNPSSYNKSIAKDFPWTSKSSAPVDAKAREAGLTCKNYFRCTICAKDLSLAWGGRRDIKKCIYCTVV